MVLPVNRLGSLSVVIERFWRSEYHNAIRSPIVAHDIVTVSKLNGGSNGLNVFIQIPHAGDERYVA